MTTATRPTWLDVDPHQIPARLRAIPRWVVWRAEYNTHTRKWTKVPYQAGAPAEHAATDDPSTWASFDAALETYTREASIDGIGYVLDWDDPIAGVDLDHCVDPETGAIAPWAQTIVDRLATYTERSPSGTGLRLFAFGALPDGRRVKSKIGPRQDGKIECYDDGRYLAVTGQHVAGTPTRLENRLDALETWHRELFPPEPATNGQPARPSATPPTDDDAALLEQARHAANGDKFRALYDRGDLHGYGSASEADLALSVILAFWTQRDAARMDRLFRGSALRREKWDESRGTQTYGAKTLATAIAKCRETYEPRHGGAPGRQAATVPPAASRTDERPTEPSMPTGDERPEASSPIDAEDDPRPTLPADPVDLMTLLPKMRQAVACWNAPPDQSPHVYNIAGHACRLDWSALGTPTLVELEREHLLVLLAQAARWTRWVKQGKDKPPTLMPAVPPRHAIEAMRAEPVTRWPYLARFTAAPFFRPDGTLVVAPGYDAASHRYYVPQADLVLPPIPETPTPDDVRHAVTLVQDEVFHDFCWRDPVVDLANAWAIMLDPFLRPFYQGHTPIRVISKSVDRAGAGLLTDVLLYPSLGRCLPRTALSTSTEEVKKALFAFAMNGFTAVLFDNVNGALDQSPLAAFLTSDSIQDRILGATRIGLAESLPDVYATGIGITVSSEMRDRLCLVELLPAEERPAERTGFKHPDLRAYVREARGPLLGAILTLIRATIVQGWAPPVGTPQLGDFQGWANAVASVLAVAKIPGFLTNRARLDVADPLREAWRLLMRRCRGAYPHATMPMTWTDDFTAGKLWPLTGWKRDEPLREGGVTFPDPDVPRFLDAPDAPLPLGFSTSGGDKGMHSSFGMALAKRVGQLFDGWRLDYVGDEHNAKVYRLTRPGPPTPPPAWVTELATGDDAGGTHDAD